MASPWIKNLASASFSSISSFPAPEGALCSDGQMEGSCSSSSAGELFVFSHSHLLNCPQRGRDRIEPVIFLFASCMFSQDCDRQVGFALPGTAVLSSLASQMEDALYDCTTASPNEPSVQGSFDLTT